MHDTRAILPVPVRAREPARVTIPTIYYIPISLPPPLSPHSRTHARTHGKLVGTLGQRYSELPSSFPEGRDLGNPAMLVLINDDRYHVPPVIVIK